MEKANNHNNNFRFGEKLNIYEDLETEFKEATFGDHKDMFKDILRFLIASLNTESLAAIYFGITDEGIAQGVPIEDTDQFRRDLSAEIYKKCVNESLRIKQNYYSLTFHNVLGAPTKKAVIKFSITRIPNDYVFSYKPSENTEVALIRQGSTTHTLKPHEIVYLTLQKVGALKPADMPFVCEPTSSERSDVDETSSEPVIKEPTRNAPIEFNGKISDITRESIASTLIKHYPKYLDAREIFLDIYKQSTSVKMPPGYKDKIQYEANQIKNVVGIKRNKTAVYTLNPANRV
jgi:hypothetical protein